MTEVDSEFMDDDSSEEIEETDSEVESVEEYGPADEVSFEVELPPDLADQNPKEETDDA
jgi:hypothetical protein